MSNPKQKEIFILLLCLLVGFALRFYTLDKKSLWLDEIYTYNEAKYDIKEQLKFYAEKPYYLQPPLFFILTHQFYPFTKPERDLRIIPLIFGILSIPMIYLLARLFSPGIALPCALSLTFMAYHISLSQDGRSYTLLLFLGISGLYFFMKYLKTLKKRFLLPAAFLFATLLHTSYSSIPFIVFSQVLWFYGLHEEKKRPPLSSFLIFNGLLLLFCLPWLLFLLFNYKGQPVMGHRYRPDLGTFWSILYGLLHDWAPYLPLQIVSIILLALFPFFSRPRKNAFILLALFISPLGAIYLYCQLFKVTHFLTSRYFINFFPFFLITLYLSLTVLEDKWGRLKRIIHWKVLFLILLIASNLIMLPSYYRSEKEDFRGLANYLKSQIRNGDKIIVGTELYIPGILHYLGIFPEGRLYLLPSRRISENELEYIVPLVIQNKRVTIIYSPDPWNKYVKEGERIWMVVNKTYANEVKKAPPFILKGFFDGSFLNFIRFPMDASMYLFLWDPLSPHEKGIDIPIE